MWYAVFLQNDDTALIQAANHGHLPVVTMLLDAKQGKHTRTYKRTLYKIYINQISYNVLHCVWNISTISVYVRRISRVRGVGKCECGIWDQLLNILCANQQSMNK